MAEKQATKKSTRKTTTAKKKDVLDDILVDVAQGLAEKAGIDKKIASKKNIKAGTKLVKELAKNNEAVDGAIKTLETLLGNKK